MERVYRHSVVRSGRASHKNIFTAAEQATSDTCERVKNAVHLASAGPDLVEQYDECVDVDGDGQEHDRQCLIETAEKKEKRERQQSKQGRTHEATQLHQANVKAIILKKEKPTIVLSMHRTSRSDKVDPSEYRLHIRCPVPMSERFFM